MRRTKGRRENFWAKWCKQCTPHLHTPSLVSWESEHVWKPLLDPEYSEVFSTYCDKYAHYFDATKGFLGVDDEHFPLLQSDTMLHHCAHCFTALEEDLFMPRGFYVGSGDKPVVFDSGCTMSITPFKEDFVGKIDPVQKTITGLSSTVEVEGEGTVL